MSKSLRLTIDKIKPVDRPIQLPPKPALLGPTLIQASDLIRAGIARQNFGVTGQGVCVAVLDTGLRVTHVDFAGRVPAQKNFTADNGGDPDNAKDGHGHGTNVGGIIVANGRHIGIAPAASIVPVKVLSNNGGGSFEGIRDALQWVLDNHAQHKISCVSMSLGDAGNYQDDGTFANDAIQDLIRKLKTKRVAVVVAAGNDFFSHGSAQGMGYPAIFKETISVGAVYDANEGSFSYGSGAIAFSTAADRITPFSQRLHRNVAPQTYTNAFAPGAPLTSSGIDSDHGESTQHGTSQATPIISGIVLLLQSYYKAATGDLPEVDDVIGWLEADAVPIFDGDDEDDNVTHTNLAFLRPDCVGALAAAKRHIERCILGQPAGRAATAATVAARIEGAGLTMPSARARPMAAARAAQGQSPRASRWDGGRVAAPAVLGQRGSASRRDAQAGAAIESTVLENPRPLQLRPLDDRIIVARPDIFPSRCVGQVVVRLRNGQVFQGSGSLLSDYTVLTAGHMVKDANNNFFDMTELRFIPAKNHGSEPYGRFDWEHMRAVRSGGRDWCLISLARPAGFSVGFLGAFAQLPIDRWVGARGLSHVGFPGDHRDEMWIDEEGSVTAIDASRQLRTNIDAAAGQSGGPLARNWFSGNPQVVGSLVGGPNPVEDPNVFMPGYETSRDDTWMQWLCTTFGKRHPDDRFAGCGNALTADSTEARETSGAYPVSVTEAVYADDAGPDVRRFRPAESTGIMTPQLAETLETAQEPRRLANGLEYQQSVH